MRSKRGEERVARVACVPSLVCSSGTFPIGLILRKAGVLLSLPISNGGTAISNPLYRAMISDCSACVLPAKV